MTQHRRTRYVLGALAAAILAVPGASAVAATPASGGSPPNDPYASPTPTPTPTPAARTAFDGNGMWIWYVSQSTGGRLSAIAAKAHRHNITTLFIKSSDSGNTWDQFSPALIRYFHARGLKVCAWQYVYGNHPAAEADRGAEAVGKGADCLVIDAEAEYEHKYISASTYINRLRAKIGQRYPVALAGFPYVDFHPAFPYSVFLGPGGAQYNQPQMYWHTIGTSVDKNYSHTYSWNKLYARPIFPIGQTYDRAPVGEIARFRKLARVYRAGGVSWWDWQESTESRWRAVGQALSPLTGVRPSFSYPVLARRSKGDFVVWAQQHLLGAGYIAKVNGIYDTQTTNAVRRLQSENGLPVDGRLGPATWTTLLAFRPTKIVWRSGGPAFAASARRDGAVVSRPPASASLPAVRYEIPPKRHR